MAYPSPLSVLCQSAGKLFDVREPGTLTKVLDRFFIQFGTPPADAAAVAGARALHAFLTATLADWCQNDGPSPVLTNRVERRLAIAVVECGECDANVELTGEKQWLCGGCGAVVLSLVDPCSCCASTGKVVFTGVGALCPFCRKGGVRRVPRG